MATDCLFCRIIAGEIGSSQVYTDEDVVVIRDIAPQAPIHVLIIPRKHLATINDLGPQDAGLMDRVCAVARKLAEQEGVARDGYRLVVNTGRNGGQSVDHLHVHMLGGRPMAWPPG